MTRTETKYSYDHANECEIMVDGRKFLVWDNFRCRCTEAMCYDTGDYHALRTGGYLSSERTIRRRIREMIWD